MGHFYFLKPLNGGGGPQIFYLLKVKLRVPVWLSGLSLALSLPWLRSLLWRGFVPFLVRELLNAVGVAKKKKKSQTNVTSPKLFL